MELTGNCREDFTKWLYNNKSLKRFINLKCGLIADNFGVFPESMKWGVLVDFFDSKDICIEIGKMHYAEEEIDVFFYFMINDSDEANQFKTRSEARKAAILTANKIYNETSNN